MTKSSNSGFSWQDLGSNGVTQHDPWIADPLKVMPNPTDQVVYFSFADVLFLFVFVSLILYGIWKIYLDVRDKIGAKNSEGWVLILIAGILIAIDNQFCSIEHYMTQSDASQDCKWIRAVQTRSQYCRKLIRSPSRQCFRA